LYYQHVCSTKSRPETEIRVFHTKELLDSLEKVDFAPWFASSAVEPVIGFEPPTSSTK